MNVFFQFFVARVLNHLAARFVPSATALSLCLKIAYRLAGKCASTEASGVEKFSVIASENLTALLRRALAINDLANLSLLPAVDRGGRAGRVKKLAG
jgi:hypothetical protein